MSGQFFIFTDIPMTLYCGSQNTHRLAFSLSFKQLTLPQLKKLVNPGIDIICTLHNKLLTNGRTLKIVIVNTCCVVMANGGSFHPIKHFPP